MADSKTAPAPQHICQKLALPFLLLTSLPVFLALILAGWHSDFNPSPLPVNYGFRSSVAAAEEYSSVLGVSERVGEGLLGPEDLAYDANEGVLYAGSYDGWIRKVSVAAGKDEKVEDWVKVGGRPLGLAFAPDGSLVVAEAYTGLLKVSKEGEVNILTDEAEGKKFKLTDGVDVASNGVIYFTDASYKYDLDMHSLDIYGGRPHGRLLSFDPSANKTSVLLRDLYFANGVSLAPDQKSLIFCETPLWRCRRYYIEGEKKGSTEEFVENLPGFPDNIRYDGDGHYLIGLAAPAVLCRCRPRPPPPLASQPHQPPLSPACPMQPLVGHRRLPPSYRCCQPLLPPLIGRTIWLDLLMKYPLLRKLKVGLGSHVNFPPFKHSGLIRVNLEGKPVALYKDPELSLVTGGLKIGKHLYFGSLFQNHLLRIDITELAAKV